MSDDIADIYGADDEIETLDPLSNIVSVKPGDMVTEIEVNGHKIKTVNPGYVSILERRLIETERQLRQLRSDMIRTGNSMRTIVNELNQVRSQLDGKIDRG